MNFAAGWDMLGWLASTIAVGRVLLSLLPAGIPGRHALGQLPVTLATSYLLGAIAIEAETLCLSAIGVDARIWILALPWILIAFARWATLPAAFLPRGELAAEPARAGTQALRWLSVIAVAILAWKQRELLFPHMHHGSERVLVPGARAIADVLALIAVCGFGLESARRAPLERALVIALLACLLALGAFAGADRPALRVMLCFGAGAAFAIPWLRRADRRAGLLAVIAFAGASIHSTLGAALGLLGLVWLWACSARPSRKLLLVSGTIAWASCVVLRRAGEQHPPPSLLGTWSPEGLLANEALFFVLASLFALIWMLSAWKGWRRRRRERAPAELGSGGGDAGSLERAGIEFLSELGASTLIALLAYGLWTNAFTRVEAPLLFAPVLGLSVGLALVRADRNAERA